MINIIYPKYHYGSALCVFPPYKGARRKQSKLQWQYHDDAQENSNSPEESYHYTLLKALIQHPAFPRHKLLLLEISSNGHPLHCYQINPNQINQAGHQQTLHLIYNVNTCSYSAAIKGEVITPPLNGNSLVNSLLLLLGEKTGARICGLAHINRLEFASYPDEVIRLFRQNVFCKRHCNPGD